MKKARGRRRFRVEVDEFGNFQNPEHQRTASFMTSLANAGDAMVEGTSNWASVLMKGKAETRLELCVGNADRIMKEESKKRSLIVSKEAPSLKVSKTTSVPITATHMRSSSTTSSRGR